MRLLIPPRKENSLGAAENGAFHRCIELINTGDVFRAKSVLALDVICKDSDNVAAWALMAYLADDRGEEIHCLEQVLRLRPNDPFAKMHLLGLRNVRANGGKPSEATTRPLRYSRREILWGSEDASNSWSRLQGRGFGTSKGFLGWGIIPELQGAWPTGLKFRSMTTENGNRPRKSRKLTNTFRGVLDAFVIMIIISAVVLLLTPRLMGANLLVVVSQSMEPTIPMGSIVVSHPQAVDEEISVGEVITFSVADLGSEEVFVTHRVVEAIRNGVDVRYRTQGDGVNESDLILVAPDQIVGRMWFSLPLVGYLVAFIRTPLGYLTLVGLPALLFILHEWWEILRPRRDRKNSQLSAISDKRSAFSFTMELQ
jgi:signal peptidase